MGACKITPDAHNINVDTLCQTPVPSNTQGENKNAILTSLRLNHSGFPAETLKRLTINDAGYYDSDKYDTKGDSVTGRK